MVQRNQLYYPNKDVECPMHSYHGDCACAFGTSGVSCICKVALMWVCWVQTWAKMHPNKAAEHACSFLQVITWQNNSPRTQAVTWSMTESAKVPKSPVQQGVCALILQFLFKVRVASSKLPETLECVCILLWVTDVLTDQFGCITNILESFMICLIIQ